MGSSAQPQQFATTQWSLIVAAACRSSTQSKRALASLCEAYWYPLYAFVRRKGYQTAEAQDLTQAFFTELLEKERLQLADQQRGRFRSFLLASLSHFLANQWRDAHAQKRGGGVQTFSMDFQAGESRYSLEPAHEMTPEKIFQRRWAMLVLESAINRLRSEYEQSDKLPLFMRLKSHLGGESPATTYQEIATQLEMSEGAVKIAAHRLRKRCRELLREEVAQTVSAADEIDEELQDLFVAVG